MSWLGDKKLLRAARRGDLPAIRRALAAGASTTVTNTQGLTPLMLAANLGHSEAVTTLVEFGADVDHAATVYYPGRWSGFTALMAAACDSTADLKPVRTLIELGADPAARDHLGRRAVDYAELSGYDEIASFLRGLDS